MKRLIAVLAIAVMLSPAPAYANGTHAELPGAGTTPDSALYGLDRAWEGLSLALTFSSEARAEKQLRFAEERLSEARAVGQRNMSDLTQSMGEDYEQHIVSAIEEAESAPDDRRVDVTETVASATSQHISVLDEVEEGVPENIRETIADARSRSIRRNKEALKALAREDPVRSAEIAMNTAQTRVNKARLAAEEGDTEGAVRAVREYESYAHFGGEIASIAQQIGEDPNAVHDVVAAATSFHITVLEDVLEMVPEESRSSIQRAITRAETGRDNALDAIPDDFQRTAERRAGNQTAAP